MTQTSTKTKTAVAVALVALAIGSAAAGTIIIMKKTKDGKSFVSEIKQNFSEQTKNKNMGLTQKPSISECKRNAKFDPEEIIKGKPVTGHWNSQNDADGKIQYSCTGNLGSGVLETPSGSIVLYPEENQTCSLSVKDSHKKCGDHEKMQAESKVYGPPSIAICPEGYIGSGGSKSVEIKSGQSVQLRAYYMPPNDFGAVAVCEKGNSSFGLRDVTELAEWRVLDSSFDPYNKKMTYDEKGYGDQKQYISVNNSDKKGLVTAKKTRFKHESPF